jgi:uncharacterized repeat protein (TIGR01451 family)
MKNQRKAILAIILFAILVLFVGISAAPAANPDRQDINSQQEADNGPVVVGKAAAVGVSPPVSSLPKSQPLQPGQTRVEARPRQTGGFNRALAQDGGAPGSILAPSSNLTPDTMLNFDGISADQIGGGAPPDTVGDVGPNHYIQMVNSAFAIYDKSGNLLAGPTNINQLWSTETPATKCRTENDGDPIVLYDRLADRWFMTQFGLGDENPPNFQCIAISQTADPTGQWYTYSFPVVDTTEYNDYGKFGVWPDGYYAGANENTFTAYVFERSKMLTGDPTATFQKINSGPNMMLPSDLDGPTSPPSNAPNYYYTMLDGNVLEVWEFTVDWTTPANSTFVKVADLTSSGFIFDVGPADPTNDNSSDCIPQGGTTQALDAIGEWPMYRLQYRNHGTHESLVGNFTVDTDATTADQAGVHWFELRRTGGLAGTWTIYQEGTQAQDNLQRWMGSAAMDQAGNIALGYSVSSNSMFPEIRYASRQASDPLGTMGSEKTMHAGTGSQTDSNRWGDYSSMNVDPADDCTFWYTNEYIATNGGPWLTRIGSFKEPSCGTPPTLVLTKSVNNNAPNAGQVISYTITVDNNTMDMATNGVISDTIPAGLTLAGPITLDPAGAGTVGAPPTLVSNLTISSSARISVTFPVTVSAGITESNVQIVNTAAVTSTETTTPQTGAVAITVNKMGGTIYLPVILKN